MRPALRLFVFVVVLLSALGVPFSALADTTQDTTTEPYIITFTPNTTSARGLAASLGRDNGFRVDHSFDTVIKGFSARLTARQVSILQALSQVVNVVPDLPVHIADSQTVPTGVSRIGDLGNQTAAIDGTDNPLNIDIATLDTGVDPTHPDLNVAGGYNCMSDDTSAWADDNGHGTHVAGIIAARDNGTGVVGVAPGARIWAVKVFGSDGTGLVSYVICGINWVAGHARTIKAVNFSGTWKGSNTANCGNAPFKFLDDPKHQAICNLVNTVGIPFVVAAGNGDSSGNGVNASSTLPAAYPETIAVGAIADSDGLPGGQGPSTWAGPDDTRAGFSNYGSVVDIFAPGVDILSTWIGDGYNTLSGTSMATPYVTGAVALYLLNHPGSTPAQVRQALLANGDNGPWGAPYGNQPLLDVNKVAFGGGFQHDVEVTSITAPNPAQQTAANSVTVHIHNQGNVPESNLSVVLKDGDTEVSTQGPFSLPIDGDTDVSFSWTPTTSGNHTLTATVSNADTSHSKSTTVNVPPSGTGQKIWLNGLSVSAAGGKRMTGQVSVAGDSGPVSDAMVALRVWGGSLLAGYTTLNLNVTTGPDGTGTIDLTLPSTGSYSVWVTGITHGADVYTPSKNTVFLRSVYIN